MLARYSVILFLLAAPALAAPVPKVVLSAEQEKEFNQLWDGRSPRESWEVRFFCRLVQQPEAAVAYLSQVIKPAQMTEKEGKQLIADLDSSDESVRRRAYIDLYSRDIRLSMPLSEAWKLAKSDAQKYLLARSYWDRPMPSSLDGMSATFTERPRDPDSPFKWKVAITINGEEDDWLGVPEVFDEGLPNPHKINPPTRVAIGITALARIDSPAARKHLKALASGRETARTTKAANNALHDLEHDRNTAARFDEKLWHLRWYEFADAHTADRFLATPKESVSFFKEKLRPVKLTNAGAKKLLAQLFSDDKKDVLAAARELQVVDLQLEMDFNDIWKEAKTATHRCRLVDTKMLWEDQPYNAIPDNFDIDVRNKLLDYEYKPQSVQDPQRVGQLGCVWRADVPEKDRPGGKPKGQDLFPFSTVKGETDSDRWYREVSAIYILDAIDTDDAVAIIKDMATGHPDAGPTKAAKDVLKRRGVK